MKSAVLFLTGMYVHLILSIAVPVGVFFAAKYNHDKISFLLVTGYLLMVGIVHFLGWISAGMAICAYRSRDYEKLIQGWKLLKFWSVPFYILNFIFSFVVWFVLIGASRGILFLFVPIPILFTCSMIVQSGIFGICVVRYLRRPADSERKPAWIHYILQLISVLDLASTVLILKKYPVKGKRHLPCA